MLHESNDQYLLSWYMYSLPLGTFCIAIRTVQIQQCIVLFEAHPDKPSSHDFCLALQLIVIHTPLLSLGYDILSARSASRHLWLRLY
jgi:hypothetical protein